MEIAARHAGHDDVDTLVSLYRELEAEQAALRPLWPLADGLDEPVAERFHAAIDDPDALVLLGMIDGLPLGFLYARPEPLLAQAEGAMVGTVRLIHTNAEARGVGVGSTMMALALARMRADGLRLFDARVSPGHRNAKNFFEAHGFSARLIVMHHSDEGEGGGDG